MITINWITDQSIDAATKSRFRASFSDCQDTWRNQHRSTGNDVKAKQYKAVTSCDKLGLCPGRMRCFIINECVFICEKRFIFCFLLPKQTKYFPGKPSALTSLSSWFTILFFNRPIATVFYFVNKLFCFNRRLINAKLNGLSMSQSWNLKLAFCEEHREVLKNYSSCLRDVLILSECNWWFDQVFIPNSRHGVFRESRRRERTKASASYGRCVQFRCNEELPFYPKVPLKQNTAWLLIVTPQGSALVNRQSVLHC